MHLYLSDQIPRHSDLRRRRTTTERPAVGHFQAKLRDSQKINLCYERKRLVVLGPVRIRDKVRYTAQL
jgi:hypothetical protein